MPHFANAPSLNDRHHVLTADSWTRNIGAVHGHTATGKIGHKNVSFDLCSMKARAEKLRFPYSHRIVLKFSVGLIHGPYNNCLSASRLACFQTSCCCRFSRWSGDVIARDWRYNILLPYPIRQPARGHKFAFAVTARVIECWCICTSESFSLVLYHNWNSELHCKYEKCRFRQLGSLFQFDGESVLHLDGSDLSTWIAQHAALAASYRKLENHLVF